MGGRLSMPRGADGMSETSKPTASPTPARLTRSKGIVNGRVWIALLFAKAPCLRTTQTVMAPLAALTMAGLLFVYARTSIRAAKLNAQKHREADGGQISWHKESMRRHGQLEKVDNDRSTLKEAFQADFTRSRKDKGAVDEEAKARTERSPEEEQLRKMMGKDE